MATALSKRQGEHFMEEHSASSRQAARKLRVAELYERCGPSVYRRALSLLHNPEEALDITQDAFVRLVQRQETLRSDAESFVLLRQIATRLSVDRLRRRGRWSRWLVTPETGSEPVEVHSAEPGHEAGARRVEAAWSLALLIRRISPRALKAALLHFVEGYSFSETAIAMGISAKTVGRLVYCFVVRVRKRSARFEQESKTPGT
jgi:RNA polymerase sigma-70 factor (ECF subfamily)